jgi:hypothetical protein
VHRGCWCRNLNHEHHFENLRGDGKIILKLTLNAWGGENMDWTYPAQDMYW